MSLRAADVGMVDVPAGLIDAGPNDRQTFSGESLGELARSIEANGLAQPPTLRPVGDRFEIVAGERRVRAMRDVLGWDIIPAYVRVMDDARASAIMLVENVQRVDLDPLEEARGYASRIERFGYSRAELARVAGVSAERITRRLALLELIPDVAHLVSTRQLPLGYASLMVRLDSDRQRLAIRAWAGGGMSQDAYGLLCSRLLLEQGQEDLFNPESFLAVADYRQSAIDAAGVARDDSGMASDPVGTRDIAERLGVKPQTVAQWKVRGLMPEPRWTVSGQPCWEWADVLEWAKASGRAS